jgi:DNA-binding FadR family transcriptional regulator
MAEDFAGDRAAGRAAASGADGAELRVPPALSESAALAQLRAYVADGAYRPGDRLPPERRLCAGRGVRRGDQRKALATLERENVLWRHVGKGTFLSAQPAASAQGGFDEIARQVSPADVMRARAALEPALAREAALHASAAAIAKLRQNAERARAAATWREYEAIDNEFHRLIADAAGSLK